MTVTDMFARGRMRTWWLATLLAAALTLAGCGGGGDGSDGGDNSNDDGGADNASDDGRDDNANDESDDDTGKDEGDDEDAIGLDPVEPGEARMEVDGRTLVFDIGECLRTDIGVTITGTLRGGDGENFGAVAVRTRDRWQTFIGFAEEGLNKYVGDNDSQEVTYADRTFSYAGMFADISDFSNRKDVGRGTFIATCE